MSFASLGLRKPILAGIKAAGYEKPTEIQVKSIPLVLEGRDLISLGETGSGKTAAFGLPILDMLLDHEPGLRAVVLVPTRELCVQVAESLRTYASRTDINVCTAFGGVDIRIQESAFKRGLDILVACPGRLIDHLERGNLSLEDVGAVVLDEADRMLDMGFLPQIRRILTRCPPRRTNLLFSATMPPDVERLCKDFLPDAERTQVGRRSQAAATIDHRFEEVAPKSKTGALAQVLSRERGRVLIFVGTKINAGKLGRELKGRGLPADSIHGDKPAETRYTILQQFDRGKIRYLVATDVAARGIDVDDIELVVNYDMPRAMEDYIHRVGRTGRAGKVGRALSLVTSRDSGLHRRILKHLGSPASERPASERSRSERNGAARNGAARNGRPASSRRRESRDADRGREPEGRRPRRTANKPRVASTGYDEDRPARNRRKPQKEPARSASGPAAKKTPAKRAAVKTATQPKPAARKAAAKTPAAKKPTTKKTVAKKAAPSRSAAKKKAAKRASGATSPAKKPVAKKSPTKKSSVKKPVAKKSPAKKSGGKKQPARKPSAPKQGPKKRSSRRSA